MKRTLFLAGLATLAVTAATPRLAAARTLRDRVRIVRAPRAGRSMAGACAAHRTRRWAGFTAADVLG